MIHPAQAQGVQRRAPKGSLLAFVLIAAISAGYFGGVAEPMLRQSRGISREIRRLEDRREVTAGEATMWAQSPGQNRDRLPRANEVLPEISLVGRQSGLRIQAIKQLTSGSADPERAVRIHAQGHFTAVLAFLDNLEGAVPQGRVDELSLRRSSESAEIELESILSVRVGGVQEHGMDRCR